METGAHVVDAPRRRLISASHPSASHLPPSTSADWTLLAATTFVVSSLAAWLVRRRVASAYLVVAPAACWTGALLLAPAARVWRDSAGRVTKTTFGSLTALSAPTSTAIATASLAPAWIAFPTYLEFAELVFGMTARSLSATTALRGYAHDAVCGAAAGAFSFFLLPMILTLLREPETKKETKREKSGERASRRRRTRRLRRFGPIVGPLKKRLRYRLDTSLVRRVGGGRLSLDRRVCARGRLAVDRYWAVPSSLRRGDAEYAARRPTPSSRNQDRGPGRPPCRAAGFDVSCDDVRVDMASYAATSDVGACVIRDPALADEMAASVPIPSLAPATPPREGLDSQGEEFSDPGAADDLLAVDRSCARRVAVVPGGDVKNVPVGPWRLVALGGAGTGTGNVRYAAFGAGGGNATTTSAGFVVWVETRKNASARVRGAPWRRCADHDVEVSAVRRILDAAPKWTTAFAKHHTPLKAARVARSVASSGRQLGRSARKMSPRGPSQIPLVVLAAQDAEAERRRSAHASSTLSTGLGQGRTWFASARLFLENFLLSPGSGSFSRPIGRLFFTSFPRRRVVSSRALPARKTARGVRAKRR